MTWTIERLERIEKAIIASKPKKVDGVATYCGQTYTSLDDAWDWFEDDLQTIKDLQHGDFDFIEHMLEQKGYKPYEYLEETA
jgi:hypothetical protein